MLPLRGPRALPRRRQVPNRRGRRRDDVRKPSPDLYGADIEVIKAGSRYVVVGEHIDHPDITLVMPMNEWTHVTTDLLSRGFVQQAPIAAALLALVAGMIGPFIVMRANVLRSTRIQ